MDNSATRILILILLLAASGSSAFAACPGSSSSSFQAIREAEEIWSKIAAKVKDSWDYARASYYKAGTKTACGGPFNPKEITFASLAFPLGTMIEFSYQGYTKVAVQTDFGPFITGRKFDLTSALKEALHYSTDSPIQYRVLPKRVNCGPNTGKTYAEVTGKSPAQIQKIIKNTTERLEKKRK